MGWARVEGREVFRLVVGGVDLWGGGGGVRGVRGKARWCGWWAGRGYGAAWVRVSRCEGKGEGGCDLLGIGPLPALILLSFIYLHLTTSYNRRLIVSAVTSC